MAREILETLIHKRDKDKELVGSEWDMAQCQWYINEILSQLRTLIEGRLPKKASSGRFCPNIGNNYLCMDKTNGRNELLADIKKVLGTILE